MILVTKFMWTIVPKVEVNGCKGYLVRASTITSNFKHCKVIELMSRDFVK